MSKSYWLKDQKGNFSNEQEDTFDESKRYVGIRLQQGVPLLDRDWNELDDIRRYEEVMLRKWYVGNGTPDDGFKISSVGPPAKNNFKIKAGRCIVDGFEVVNDKEISYKGQKGVTPLRPGTNRVDTVYLDVWIEEVKSQGNTDPLANPQDVNIETCVRHKLAWQVKVSEGSVYPKDLPFHHYYNIAKITRKAGRDTILDTDIQDLRRTGLGRDIAIGDNSHRAGKIRLWQEHNNEDDCVSHAIGTESFHNIYGAGKNYANSIGHRFYCGGGDLIAHIGFGGKEKPDNRLNSSFAGNVGIGTLTPQNKLQLGSGDIAIGDNKVRAGKIRLWQEPNNEDDFVSHAIGVEAYHNIYGAGKMYENTVGHKFYRGGGELIAQIGFGGKEKPDNRLNSYFAGNVGIGTEDPRAKLEVIGNVKVTGNFIKAVMKTTSPLSDAGWYRIAQGPGNGGNNAGIFEIRWAVGGRHGHVRFAVGANYGYEKGSQITILDQSSYSDTFKHSAKIVDKIRLLMKGTYDRHFIEFHFEEESKAVPFVISQYSGYGWDLIEPRPGSIPDDYTTQELRADVLFATRSGTTYGLFTVDNDGKVGIGLDNPKQLLYMRDGAYCNGKKWIEASSIEYKKDVTPLTQKKALETLAGLSPVTFRYDEEAEDEKHVGFIAEEVPELVATKERKGLSSMDIVGILTRVVQYQQKEIEELKARLNKGQ